MQRLEVSGAVTTTTVDVRRQSVNGLWHIQVYIATNEVYQG